MFMGSKNQRSSSGVKDLGTESDLKLKKVLGMKIPLQM